MLTASPPIDEGARNTQVEDRLDFANSTTAKFRNAFGMWGGRARTEFPAGVLASSFDFDAMFTCLDAPDSSEDATRSLVEERKHQELRIARARITGPA